MGENAESPEDIAQAVDRVIEQTRKSVDELADLEQPEGDAGETAEEFVNATREEIQGEGIPALEDLRAALESGDEEAAQEAAARLQEIDTERVGARRPRDRRGRLRRGVAPQPRAASASARVASLRRTRLRAAFQGRLERPVADAARLE